ncbi:MAG: FkbM family methyltransferase [Cyclobacteriaceae bacterium]|nr:FkbM family methyltransferase [Cyclobacteriaceae bacterium]
MNKKIKHLVISFFGTSILQGVLERIHYVVLRLMNYGGANSVWYSGERDILLRIRSEQKTQEMVVFDVGANVGQYARLVRSVFPKAKIHCFEPSSSAFEQLNKLSDTDVVLNNLAFGADSGFLTLYSDLKGSVKSTLVPADGEVLTERVSIMTLDGYCRDRGIHSIDLLKIDVEGFELDVLKGSNSMLTKKAIRYIQFEFGGMSNIRKRVFLRDFYLMLPQYKIGRVTQSGFREIKYQPKWEIYLTTNYLAIIS